jgi:hypothetical protein
MKNDSEDSIRFTGNGFQTEGLDGGDVPAHKLGIGDKKKVTLLALLVLAGAGVAAYQFLGGSGSTPTPAAAATPTDSTATGPLPAIPTADGKTGAGGTSVDELSVARVEQLVKEFDGYVRAHQVGLNKLHSNPFRSKIQSKPKDPVEGQNAGPAETVKTKPREAPPKMTLGSIMVAGGKSMAMINGKLCAVGGTIAGCRVESIETERVVLSRGGDTYELQIKPRSAPTEERGTDDN